MAVLPFFRAPKRPVSRVFIHCSASDRPQDDRASVIRDWHIRRGFATIGYHFYVRKDGTVEPGRNLEKIPAAQEGNNTGTIAICLGGLEKDRFTEAQFDSLRSLCYSIHEQLPMVTFHGHCEVNRNKTCPVLDYRKVLRLNSRGELLA